MDDRILELKEQGHSLRQIAAKLGVGYGRVCARLLKGCAKKPDERDQLTPLSKDTWQRQF